MWLWQKRNIPILSSGWMGSPLRLFSCGMFKLLPLWFATLTASSKSNHVEACHLLFVLHIFVKMSILFRQAPSLQKPGQPRAGPTGPGTWSVAGRGPQQRFAAPNLGGRRGPDAAGCATEALGAGSAGGPWWHGELGQTTWAFRELPGGGMKFSGCLVDVSLEDLGGLT